MAGRIRSIKPEILEDEKTAALPHLEWRLFVSLWLIADDHGNLRGDPGYVQGQTLWASSETREAVAGALEALVAVDLLARYTVRGQAYYHVAGWAKHQKVDHPGKPRMPGPDEGDSQPSPPVAPDREGLAEVSPKSRETLAPDLRPPTSDQDQDRETSRAIPPTAVPVPEPTPVPAMSPPAPAREDIARTQPIADPATRPEPTLDQLWTELEQARLRAAAVRGVAIQLLVAHDVGRHDLAEALVEAARVGRRPELVAQIRHAIGAAEAESRVAPEPGKPDRLQWFTGAIFSPRNFRRLVAAPLPKSRAGPRSAPRDPPPPREVPVGERAGPEHFAESRALLAALTSNPDDTPTDEKPRRKARA